MGETNPYAELGEQLRSLRQEKNESLAEVSCAIEIEQHILEQFEAGIDRPDEDILNLLINHYRLRDNLADHLWELAGYGSKINEEALFFEEAFATAKQLIMVLSSEGRALYTDDTTIDYSKNGLQITFTQSIQGGKSIPVARVGMSYSQAASLATTLSLALLHARYSSLPRALPPGDKV